MPTTCPPERRDRRSIAPIVTPAPHRDRLTQSSHHRAPAAHSSDLPRSRSAAGSRPPGRTRRAATRDSRRGRTVRWRHVLVPPHLEPVGRQRAASTRADRTRSSKRGGGALEARADGGKLGQRVVRGTGQHDLHVAQRADREASPRNKAVGMLAGSRVEPDGMTAIFISTVIRPHPPPDDSLSEAVELAGATSRSRRFASTRAHEPRRDATRDRVPSARPHRRRRGAVGGRLSWVDVAVFLTLYVLTGLGTTVGYHRLFTHRSFETTKTVRATFAILGSMTIQGPVTQWVTDHRKHHALSDLRRRPALTACRVRAERVGSAEGVLPRAHGLAVPSEGDGARRPLRQGSLRRPADPRDRPDVLRSGSR